MYESIEDLVKESRKPPPERAIRLAERAVELAREEHGDESTLFIHANQNLAWVHMMLADCQLAVDIMSETMTIANKLYTTDEVSGDFVDMGALRELFGRTLVERANQLDPRINQESVSRETEDMVRQLRLHAVEQFRRAIGVALTHVQLDAAKKRCGMLASVLLALGEDVRAGNIWEIAAKIVKAEKIEVVDPEAQPLAKRQRSR